MATIRTGVHKHMDLEKMFFTKKRPSVQVCFPEQYQWEYYYLYEKTEWEARQGVETFAREDDLSDPDNWFRAYKLEREFLALVKSVLKEREME